MVTEAGIQKTDGRLIEAWLVSGTSLWCPCSRYAGGRILRSQGHYVRKIDAYFQVVILDHPEARLKVCVHGLSSDDR